MAFDGYYLKIGDCKFQSPAIKREGYKLNPRIVQVTDNKVLASGKISIKELPHKPTKITVEYVPEYQDVSEIVSDYWIDQLMKMCIAYTKIVVGRVRSRYTQSGALWQQDGEAILQEGL